MTTFTFSTTGYGRDMMTSILHHSAKHVPMAKRQLRLWLKLKHALRSN